MKHRLSEKQTEMVLRRYANQTRLAPRRAENGLVRVLLETLAGVFMGIPLGISLYYFALSAYYPVMLCLLFAGGGIASAFQIPDSSRQTFVQGLNFGPVVVVPLAVLATALGIYFTRGAIQQGYRVFAWVQMPLMLPVMLTLFYLTLLYHKPLLPFYGQ